MEAWSRLPLRLIRFMRPSRFSSMWFSMFRTCPAFKAMFTAILVLIVWRWGTPFALAQAPGARANQTFTVSGSVVNETTGESIPRAMVTLQGSPMRNAFTDTNGAFAIEGVPAGRYSITAQKPGYFGSQEKRTSGSVQMVEARANGDSVTLKLAQESVIFGRLTDPNGQPIESVSVHLMQRTLRNGALRTESRSSTNSDDDGTYRFANLQPGTYYVAAGPEVPRREALFAENNTPRTGWPALYYPQAPDAASAAPIHVASGQQAQADMVMSRVPLYTVSGVVTGFAPGQGVSLMVQNSSGDMVAVGTRFHHDTGEFEIHLPAGSYRLKAVSHVEGQQMLGVIRITLEKDLNQLQMALQPAPAIPIHVRVDDRSQSVARPGPSASVFDRRSRGVVAAHDAYDSPPLSVHLVSTDPGGSDVYSVNRGTQGNRTVSLSAVEPGRYTAEISPYGGWYVESAQCGNSNLLSEDLVVTPGSSCTMEIGLRNDGGTLNAKVEGANTAGGGMALLVPARGHSTPRSLPFYVPDGSHEAQVTLDGIAPGEYVLYPFDDPQGVEYSNPEVLRSYSSQAAAVTISPGQMAKVTAQLIHTGVGEE
jgi:hypothetical protein